MHKWTNELPYAITTTTTTTTMKIPMQGVSLFRDPPQRLVSSMHYDFRKDRDTCADERPIRACLEKCE
jgi:hypothetical protein